MRRIARLASACWAFAATTGALAEGWSGGVGLTSDKVYRGLSQSSGHPSVFADLRWQTDTGWAVGGGIATVRSGDGSTAVEFIPAVSRSWQLDGDWTLQLAASHYGYSGALRAFRYDEASVTAGWRGRVYATLAWSPNTYARRADGSVRTDHATVYELDWHQPLAGRFTLDAGIGRNDLSAVAGKRYTYGSASLGWGVGAFGLYLSCISSGAASAGLVPAGRAGTRWAATAIWSY